MRTRSLAAALEDVRTARRWYLRERGRRPAEDFGRAYREIGNSSAANVAFQIIIDSYKTDPLFGQALLEQGRTKFLANDITGAIQTYFNIADTYDYLPEAAEALWRVGYLYGTNDNPGESRKVFERLAC